MANWSKRYTTTFKRSKNRITRTNNSKGTSTNSFSTKVGNTRTTQSTNSANGKVKVYTTQTHPTLGTKREVRTVNPTVRYKKHKPYKPSRKMNAAARDFANAGNGAGGIIILVFVGFMILLGLFQ
jgi:hypothetical protein